MSLFDLEEAVTGLSGTVIDPRTGKVLTVSASGNVYDSKTGQLVSTAPAASSNLLAQQHKQNLANEAMKQLNAAKMYLAQANQASPIVGATTADYSQYESAWGNLNAAINRAQSSANAIGFDISTDVNAIKSALRPPPVAPAHYAYETVPESPPSTENPATPASPQTPEPIQIEPGGENQIVKLPPSKDPVAQITATVSDAVDSGEATPALATDIGALAPAYTLPDGTISAAFKSLFAPAQRKIDAIGAGLDKISNTIKTYSDVANVVDQNYSVRADNPEAPWSPQDRQALSNASAFLNAVVPKMLGDVAASGASFNVVLFGAGMKYPSLAKMVNAYPQIRNMAENIYDNLKTAYAQNTNPAAAYDATKALAAQLSSVLDKASTGVHWAQDALAPYRSLPAGASVGLRGLDFLGRKKSVAPAPIDISKLPKVQQAMPSITDAVQNIAVLQTLSTLLKKKPIKVKKVKKVKAAKANKKLKGLDAPQMLSGLVVGGMLMLLAWRYQK